MKSQHGDKVPMYASGQQISVANLTRIISFTQSYPQANVCLWLIKLFKKRTS